MKLLSLHERVACRIPCLMEGETGVSKSALTKMYSIIRNSALEYKCRARTTEDLQDIVEILENDSFDIPTSGSLLERLRDAVSFCHDKEAIATRLFGLLQEKTANRSEIFVMNEKLGMGQAEPTVEDTLEMLDFFSRSILEKVFYDVNVDSSLTEDDFIGMFEEIRCVARKLRQSDATVVVFLDGKSAAFSWLNVILPSHKLTISIT